MECIIRLPKYSNDDYILHCAFMHFKNIKHCAEVWTSSTRATLFLGSFLAMLLIFISRSARYQTKFPNPSALDKDLFSSKNSWHGFLMWTRERSYCLVIHNYKSIVKRLASGSYCKPSLPVALWDCLSPFWRLFMIDVRCSPEPLISPLARNLHGTPSSIFS
jgi:hypothetical protein